jgi:preprotein translocase subunit SecD
MAVDANVIIFERIREEMLKQKTIIDIIDIGYKKAFQTILDSNLTTLISAASLYLFGSGPIKGFAVTLSLGIICSMFTAIFVTRTILITFLSFRKIKELSI